MKLSRDAAQAMAAAYALGTLRGRPRRRLERMARDDRSLASLMRHWELALAPLANSVPAVEPPARVWKGIDARIAPRDTTPAASSFWRPFGLVAAGLATVLLAFFVWISSTDQRAEPAFVAVLTAQDSVPRMVISLHEPDVLRVQVVKPWKGIEGKSLELWVLPKDGAPRSLGLVANTDTVVRLRANDARLQGGTALAVSLEPAGGSPTKAPTGPVLCSGAIAPVKKA